MEMHRHRGTPDDGGAGRQQHRVELHHGGRQRDVHHHRCVRPRGGRRAARLHRGPVGQAAHRQLQQRHAEAGLVTGKVMLDQHAVDGRGVWRTRVAGAHHLQRRQAHIGQHHAQLRHAHAGHVEQARPAAHGLGPHQAHLLENVDLARHFDKAVEDGAAHRVDGGAIAHADDFEVRTRGLDGQRVGAHDRVAGAQPLHHHQHHRPGSGRGCRSGCRHGCGCGYRRECERECERYRGVEPALLQRPLQQRADGALDLVLVGPQRVAALHVDVVQHVEGQRRHVVDGPQVLGHPGQQLLALGVRGRRGQHAAGQQCQRQPDGQRAVVPEQRVQVQRQCRLGAVEQAELHQVLRCHCQRRAGGAGRGGVEDGGIEDGDQRVRTAECAGLEEVVDPAVQRQHLRQPCRRELQCRVGQQARQRGHHTGAAGPVQRRLARPDDACIGVELAQQAQQLAPGGLLLAPPGGTLEAFERKGRSDRRHAAHLDHPADPADPVLPNFALFPLTCP